MFSSIVIRFSNSSLAIRFVPFLPWLLLLAALLAPESKFLLHRPLRKAEQDRLRIGFMMMPCPARYHQNVMSTPFEHLGSNSSPAVALDYLVNRAIRRAVRLSAESTLQ